MDSHNVVAFKVGFSVNAVRDLQGEEAETHTGVVRARRQPIHLVTARQKPAVRGFPEAHVVALLGAAVYFLLVGESLRLTKIFSGETGASAQERRVMVERIIFQEETRVTLSARVQPASCMTW